MRTKVPAGRLPDFAQGAFSRSSEYLLHIVDKYTNPRRPRWFMDQRPDAARQWRHGV